MSKVKTFRDREEEFVKRELEYINAQLASSMKYSLRMAFKGGAHAVYLEREAKHRRASKKKGRKAT